MAGTDRAVSTEEGAALAEEFGAQFIEVSAKNNLRVRDAFEMLVRRVVAKRPDAGRSEGAGSVFGAGVAASDPEPEEVRPQKEAAATSPAASRSNEKKEKKEKKSKCLIL